jgi:FdrA protein
VVHVSQRLGRARLDDLPQVRLESLRAPVAAINVGLESFYESLTAQGAKAVQVDWRPPAGGDEKLMSILERMRKQGADDG